MDFTVATWKQATADKLKSIGDWLAQRRVKDAPYLAYGTLCGLSLWPLVEAARAGQLLPVMIALGSVAGSVGGNLIAEQVQRWKDRADGVGEGEIAEWVAEQVAANADVRQALDAVLEAVEAIPQAEAALGEADRTWFTETLREEMARLGNLPRFEAVLSGCGAIAQDHSVAAGSGGVAVGRDVHGGVHVANELPAQVLELFARQFGFDPAASDATALKAYFEQVILARHSKLSFLFIRPETGKVYTEADIETVFVPLRMTDPQALAHQARLARRLERFDRLPQEMEEGARPITLPEVIQKYPCFLLRGKPGCGKTTLLRHIALAFARGEQQEKLGWQGPVPLPLLVSLRNFGTFLRGRTGRYVEPQPRALLEYLEDHLQGAGVRFGAGFLPGRLERGECFLLLDALDEASGTLDHGGDVRAAVARQVAAFIRHYAPRGNRFGLTSRPRAYEDEGVMRRALPQPQVCDVFDLDGDGYRQLITNLLAVLTADTATGQSEAGELVARIAANRQLSDLAGNPLLCTTLVLVFKYRGRKLPERRVDVLHEIVTLLLGRWEEERRDVSSPDELARLGTTALTTDQAVQFRRRALVALAWQMQQDNLAEAPAEVALQTLADFYCSEERTDRTAAERWARAFLEVAHERSGLFIAMDEGMHTFAHQAFREYLAATHLVNAGEERLIGTVLEHAPAPDEWWEQVLLLAGAHPELSSGGAGRLVERLLAAGGLDHAYLAARCAQDMTDKLPGPQRKQLQDGLVATLRDDARAAKERALAGRALAPAGDPRAEVMTVEGMRFCYVPPGPFRMGEGSEEHINEHLDYAYWIGRYPVTNAQFQAFVDGGGYDEPAYWPEAEAAGTWRQGQVKGRREDEPRDRPPDYGDPFNLPNHPVVGVTWYEVLAFSRWLAEHLRSKGLLPAGWGVRLPSEAEWEKAARGGLEIPKEPNIAPAGAHPDVLPSPNPEPKRGYPWGEKADPNRANYDRAGIGTTSAVGCFPGGASPYGVEDLSGNVWEWTRSVGWGYPYDPADGRENLKARPEAHRVLRGGSFINNLRFVRCACRRGDFPVDWYDLFGFRCVVAPVPSEL